MAEIPHFLRITRALALGALAGPLSHCATSTAQNQAPPSAGSQTAAARTPQIAEAPQGGGLCRAGTEGHYRLEGRELVACRCEQGPRSNLREGPPAGAARSRRWQCTTLDVQQGSLHEQPCNEGDATRNDTGQNTSVQCTCVEEALVARWACTSFTRIAGGLDGQPCREPRQGRGDDPSSPNRACICVAHETGAEYACYQTLALAPGPLPPPEWS
ncbi:MAG: hypothetical protein JNK05_35920 [Myxococcales bacterium]|nr:hypothetical protein [Myxococcales bacterium]